MEASERRHLGLAPEWHGRRRLREAGQPRERLLDPCRDGLADQGWRLVLLRPREVGLDGLRSRVARRGVDVHLPGLPGGARLS
eukprot:1254198-Pyramimonas_sp.AAC.1